MNRRGVLHFLGLAGVRRGPPVPLSLIRGRAAATCEAQLPCDL